MINYIHPAYLSAEIRPASSLSGGPSSLCLHQPSISTIDDAICSSSLFNIPFTHYSLLD